MDDAADDRQQTARDLASSVAIFADVMLPGDHDFPSATAAGAHGLFANRVRQRRGIAALNRLCDLLDRDRPFAEASPDQRIAAVEALKWNEPDLFAFVRQTLYLTYYEMPAVIAALRTLGHDYNDAPQPDGYTLKPFDPTPGVHIPAQPRGSYKATADILPVDVAGLSDLGLPKVRR